MDKLKVGDKVYNVKRDGFADFARYTFSVVERLTVTLAVLKNGTRLKNEPKESFIMEDVGYSVAGKWGTHWHIVSLQAIRNAQIENEKIRINDWFDDRNFSLEEKHQVYTMIKEKK
ncbi:MAG: pyruvate kinase [Cellulophaga sp.]